MSLLFLKINPEDAVSKIQDMILEGYQLKDSVGNEHEQAKASGGASIVDIAPSWSQRYNTWLSSCIMTLKEVYVSEVYAYNFRDAGSFKAMTLVGNPTFSNVVLGIQYRIEKLNDYEGFIRGHVPIEINVGRDVFINNGGKSNVRTKN